MRGELHALAEIAGGWWVYEDQTQPATYRKARIRAAQAGTSVSAMVRGFLNQEEDGEAAREAKRIQAMEALYSLADQRSERGRSPVEPLSRENIYATCRR